MSVNLIFADKLHQSEEESKDSYYFKPDSNISFEIDDFDENMVKEEGK